MAQVRNCVLKYENLLNDLSARHFATLRAFIARTITKFRWIDLMLLACIFALHNANFFAIIAAT
jgi:hypothetical protein